MVKIKDEVAARSQIANMEGAREFKMVMEELRQGVTRVSGK